MWPKALGSSEELGVWACAILRASGTSRLSVPTQNASQQGTGLWSERSHLI
jgi:hypothetical protein